MTPSAQPPPVLRGIPASPGLAVAPACVFGTGEAPDRFPEGAVMVSRTTDPTMVRAMLKASAVVTLIGGPMCHTAIVALELGIPCVVAVPDVLTHLESGMTVEVDGDRGTVTVLPA